jgi:hypothetical protein
MRGLGEMTIFPGDVVKSMSPIGSDYVPLGTNLKNI